MLDEYRGIKKTLKPRELPEDVKRKRDKIVKHSDEHVRVRVK